MAEPAGGQVRAAVRAALAPAARYMSLVTQTNPLGLAGDLLRRPDVTAVLTSALDQARTAAAAMVQQQWTASGGPPDSPVLTHLLADVGRQYDSLLLLHSRIRYAHASVPQQHFVRGVTPPGVHPAHEAAAERSRAVRDAVLGFAGGVSLRSSLSVSVAARMARTERALAEGATRRDAGEKVYKRWKAHPERPTCCHWCRNLHGVTIELHASFLPYIGGPTDLSGHGHLTQPPRPYRGELQGPGLHPRCQCELEIITGSSAPVSGRLAPVPPARFVSSAEIRAMPESKYRGLLHFLSAALHELGQLLRRLVQAL